MNNQTVIEHTQNWISSMVIGLNLCPFAERGFNDKSIRYVVTDTGQPAELLESLASELNFLASADADLVLTTILIHPNALTNFLLFNDFLYTVNLLVSDLALERVIQVVGFHPEYQFQNTGAGDAQNYTNRSPYPMLHLLREASIDEVSENPESLAEIPRRNIALLEKIGLKKILERLDACVPKGGGEN